VSRDIGADNTCPHLCPYCYANVSEKVVKRNFEMIIQTGEMLLPIKRSKYQDWIYETKSCCNGCSNDCIYCFAKGDAVNKKRMKLNEWKEGKVRPHDVDKEYTLYDDPVMFPGTHDYTQDNFDACFTVLKKILAVNNRVLIVSKPRLDLITMLCDDLREYKKNMLFRFTIGSVNNEILSFWDQYAPLYEERKQSLEYAFNSGYHTSVSVEPMLDSEHIEELVNDLSPYVNHSIWIGTMNHTWYFDTDESKAKTKAGKLRARQNTEYYGEVKAKKIREATEKILEGQTKENLKKIYGKLKDHPLVQWKWHIKEAVGLPQPDTPEEWPADRKDITWKLATK
jgi:DNA repair photolyase